MNKFGIAKFKKYHLIKFKKYSKFNYLILCQYGLQAITCGIIDRTQLESIKKFIFKRIKKRDQVLDDVRKTEFIYFENSNKKFKRIWQRISLVFPVTKKSSNSRMGKGVGKIFKWINFIKPGLILFEFSYLKDFYPLSVFDEFKKINKKLSFKLKLISKNIYSVNLFK